MSFNDFLGALLIHLFTSCSKVKFGFLPTIVFDLLPVYNVTSTISELPMEQLQIRVYQYDNVNKIKTNKI